MSSTITWHGVQQRIRETLTWDLENGNLDREGDRDLLAWELADSDADGFTYYTANTLWANDVEVRDFEDEAADLDYFGVETIQERICIVVTLALRAAYREALDEILDAEVSETQEVPA